MAQAKTSTKPILQPRVNGFLPVGQGHTMYYEEYGNPAGIPVLYVHGGPGGNIDWKITRFFNLKTYRVIGFEQRGCGRSTPRFSLKANTTAHLIGDIELLREHLQIRQWLLFGGSWGSALSLFYAINHPQRVLGLILRGIFLGRIQDWDYLVRPNGAGLIKPFEYARFLELVPPAFHDQPAKWYMEVFHGKDKQKAREAGMRWAQWEGSLLFFKPKKQKRQTLSTEEANQLADELLQLALMECHYAQNASFQTDDNFILHNTDKIRHLPTWIVHGAYDLICPLAQAYELHQKLTHAKLVVVPNAAHSSSEPGIQKALKQAVVAFAKRYGSKWLKHCS